MARGKGKSNGWKSVLVAGVSGSRQQVVRGRLTYSESGRAASGTRVIVMDADHLLNGRLGEGVADKDGFFKINYSVGKFRDLFQRSPDVYLLVYDAHRRLLATTRDSIIRNAPATQEIFLELPGKLTDGKFTGTMVGGTPVDPRAFQKLDPDVLMKIANFAIHGRGGPGIPKIIHALNPELSPKRLRAQLCFAPLVRFLREAVRVKGWPRAAHLRLEEILVGYDPRGNYATFECPNFTITYQTSGTDQPPSTDTGGDITMPGTGRVVGRTTGGNGVPDYIEKLCFWLENALATYTNPPFDLRNPAAGGKIPVNVTGTSPGSAGGGSMTIGRNLNDDLLAAVPTHELMHLIQELYETAGTTGPWHPGMGEGGAVLGEDVVFDTHNRYIVQATEEGTLPFPGVSLSNSGARYYLALFLKYICEQQSGRVAQGDEPAIGVETYRTLLERFDSQDYTNGAFAAVISALPWYQSFYEINYLDAGKLDETSSETLLGNFWLACYLKDFGGNAPDRRFEFMEDEEVATWDEIFRGLDTVNTLGSVTLTLTTTLNRGGAVTLSAGSSVSPFAARFYKVNVAQGVDTLQVNFTGGVGFTRPLVQVVLVEPGNRVRDIIRSDRTALSRTIANLRNGTNLDHVLIVVAGTDTGGPFTLAVKEVAPSPDVMVSRWHHAAGTHYEIDSLGWAWTWVSPDIWVDNDGDGQADGKVFLNRNNKLFIRLRNQGHASASDISVEFWYQDASGTLSENAWIPVTDMNGVVQKLTGLSLAAGATNQWSVNWAPSPAGTSKHFCVRAVVTVPNDPNTDNKRCLTNFGNVVDEGPYYVDFSLLRRVRPEQENFRIDVIPRTNGRWLVSGADLALNSRKPARFGDEVVDVFRIRRLSKLTRRSGHVHPTSELRMSHCFGKPSGARQEVRPDPFGHYPTDSRALPPGLEKVPLVTVAYVVNGKPMGGFTLAIWDKG